jgi:hypothetical protein
MKFDSHELAALLVAISFAAGLNVYATIVSLGLLARFDVLTLPPALQVVTSWYVIGICGVLFVVEFLLTRFRHLTSSGMPCTRLCEFLWLPSSRITPPQICPSGSR